MAEEECTINGLDSQAKGDPNLREDTARRKKRKKKKTARVEESSSGKYDLKMVKEGVGNEEEVNPMAENGESEEEKKETVMANEEIRPGMEGNPGYNDKNGESLKSKNEKKMKRKERLLKEAAMADRRGVYYLSRVPPPPHMDHVELRHALSQFGEVQRIYLAPEDPTARVYRKKAGGFRGQMFSEGSKRSSRNRELCSLLVTSHKK